MNKNITISIDLAKTVIQVAIINKHGKLSSNQKVSQSKLISMVAKHPKAVICMEACATAHYWGRKFQQAGHQVLLVPAQIAAKYRSGNKNDPNDALAIYEASQRTDIHFVPVKTVEQQDLACLLRLREGYIKQRTQLANRIRGLAMEYGIKFPIGINSLRKQLPFELENAENELTHAARFILNNLKEQLLALDTQIDDATQALTNQAKQNEDCKLLASLPGISWISGSALYARLGNASAYKCGRDASASIGLVPAHTGSGGRNINLGITKRGDRYLRALVVHGARAVVSHVKDKTDPLSQWIRSLLERNHVNKVVIALANKIVRMACAILKSKQPYQLKLA
ncbi:IS110 family transposase [Vibrio sp. JC009]|uniref:IS110 family transposase n=1 Tax=Vibrio sp. JC009 TaxID=2912314 RepID=UPI0023AEF8B7|nr:IS110 family transposase [Vibrio sp. JC009]WED20569.1 IS110 family transposase [Vibrio sp. JC009]WED20574.1 IS110 family transposase [Vibrio sp. JC009]WED20622.1 IS110 family transposase [Vibrio sp. JC009]WED20978.1 IS110 family transposase [Vibrio sp. JC009]WED21016.1 IS110 family transposase [Vibrio sp. JC009]